jgi:hypothetical protein
MLSVYVSPEQKSDLVALAIVTRVPTAVRIRDAIDLVLKCARDDGHLPPTEESEES